MKNESVIPVIRKETRRVTMVFELKKDLEEHEVVCEHCHGTGLKIADNVYGIKGDATHIGVHFPYKHQSLAFCGHCYNGVQRKCPGCGNLCKQPLYCSCGYFEKQRNEDDKRKKDEQWEKATRIPINEAWEKYKCLYVVPADEYVFDSGELDDLIRDCDLDTSSLRIYATAERKIEIDAEDVAECACEGLHEDALENCNVEELQALLDKWAEQQTGVKTYYPDFEVGVIYAA